MRRLLKDLNELSSRKKHMYPCFNTVNAIRYSIQDISNLMIDLK